MHEPAAASLRQHAEPLAALSISHLSLATRQKLIGNDLSVNAYPTAQGGFVYVGSPRYDNPTETDLADVFVAAEQAGVIWLKFDAESAIIDGLPIFDAPEEAL